MCHEVNISPYFVGILVGCAVVVYQEMYFGENFWFVCVWHNLVFNNQRFGFMGQRDGYGFNKIFYLAVAVQILPYHSAT